MINYDSILSAFDGKPTLLQWLKMVKKALDESILKNVTITQNGEKVVFTFKFEDGTSISTPEVTLPKGDKGDKGDKGADIVRIETTGSKVVGVNTESTIRVELSDNSIKQFKTYAKNGSDGVNGTDGVSITGIDTVGNEVVGDETLTTLRANYSNNTTDEFIVKAKNGKDGQSQESTTYLHSIKLGTLYSGAIYFTVYSKFRGITFNEALNFIPTLTNTDIKLSDTKMPVAYSEDADGTFGALFAGKFLDNGVYKIKVAGIAYNVITEGVGTFSSTLSVVEERFLDTLIGENL